MYIHTATHIRYVPTHVDPRASVEHETRPPLLFRMRKTIFGIQVASYTRRETLERWNYTRVRVGVCTREYMYAARI